MRKIKAEDFMMNICNFLLLWVAIFVVYATIFFVPEIFNTIKEVINTDKPLVYLQNSEVNEAQLSAYARGYKAGYQEALKEIEEREYLDGGVR